MLLQSFLKPVGLVSAGALLIAAVSAAEDKPVSLGIIVFPGYQPLDVWGPLDIFFGMSMHRNISLSVIAHEVGPVTSKSPPRRNPPTLPPGMTMPTMSPSILATHTFETAPPLDIILVPGGLGNRVLEENNDTAIEDFVVARYPQLEYLLSVCTGSVSLARSGVLEGRSATTNKAAWAWAVTHGKNVTWVPSARWVQDGNIWTSSGVAAGMDMVYAFLAHYIDLNTTNTVINRAEYAPHTDPHWDPFSVVHNVPGADKARSLVDCVSPAGY